MRTPRYHVIFDLSHAKGVLTDQDGLKKFVVKLIEMIGMHIIAGPILAEGVPENPGLSCVAILDYSHVSIHTFTKFDEVLIDVFSCKPFNKDIVRETCLSYFQTSDAHLRERDVWWG